MAAEFLPYEHPRCNFRPFLRSRDSQFHQRTLPWLRCRTGTEMHCAASKSPNGKAPRDLNIGFSNDLCCHLIQEPFADLRVAEVPVWPSIVKVVPTSVLHMLCTCCFKFHVSLPSLLGDFGHGISWDLGQVRSLKATRICEKDFECHR